LELLFSFISFLARTEYKHKHLNLTHHSAVGFSNPSSCRASARRGFPYTPNWADCPF